MIEQDIMKAAEAYLLSIPAVKSIVAMLYDAFKAGALYAQQQQWISVEERLPEGEGPVLAVDTENDLYYCAWCYSKETWVDDGDGGRCYPTHLMPIPNISKNVRVNDDNADIPKERH